MTTYHDYRLERSACFSKNASWLFVFSMVEKGLFDRRKLLFALVELGVDGEDYGEPRHCEESNHSVLHIADLVNGFRNTFYFSERDAVIDGLLQFLLECGVGHVDIIIKIVDVLFNKVIKVRLQLFGIFVNSGLITSLKLFLIKLNI